MTRIDLPSRNPVFLMLTGGKSGGELAAVVAHIGSGVRGEAIRHIELSGGSGEARESAVIGTHCAYGLLFREKYLDHEIVVRFETSVALPNVHGRSADLAFALALVASWCGTDGVNVFNFPPLAATGKLADDGGILSIGELEAKLAIALAALPENSLIFFPRANEADVTEELRRTASQRKITLAACDRLEEALQQLNITLSRSWLESPFRGLEPFEFAHASIFFGREAEIQAVLALLQRRITQGRRAILIEGPSGNGKSSLVLAGVLPALVRRGLSNTGVNVRWGLLRPRAVRPDVDPGLEVDSLSLALQQAWLHDYAGVTARPAIPISAPATIDPDQYLRWLASSFNVAGAEYVLVLDQMEQWFEGQLQSATISRLCVFLARLVERGVILIGTMTKGAVDRLVEHPELSACFGVEGRFRLDKPLDAARLEAVIERPAQAARLNFETGLEAEIFAAANHGGPDVLPLLELLLTELFERRDRVHNLLRFADYAAAGGLDGVISARAESVYVQLLPEEQAAVPQLIWKLDTAAVIQLSDFAPDNPMRGLAAAFREKRLLVQDQDAGGETNLRVAHNALLRHWQRAIALRRAHEADTRLWLDLMREAGQWSRGTRALIPAGPQLAEVATLFQRRQGLWTASDSAVIAYVQASLKQTTRRRLITAFAIGGPVAVGSVIGANALFSFLENRRFRRITFDDVAVPAPDYFIPAAHYLMEHGISVENVSPDRSKLQIQNNMGLYDGRAAVDQHFLTLHAEPWAAPMSFTLRFDQSPKTIRLVRASLWAATKSGVTHPAWGAQVFDAMGSEMDHVAEELLRSFISVPTKTFLLQASEERPIATLKITSDLRAVNKAGELVPFAAFQAALIKELQLEF